MKKIFITLLFSASLLVGCTDILDVENPNQINSAIWNSETSANLYLNYLYNNSMPTTGFGKNADISDEAIGSEKITYGLLALGTEGSITTAYPKIRAINIAVQEIQKSTLAENIKKQMLGQVCFLRAWSYFELVKLYGGVPLVLNIQDPNTDSLNIPRSTTAECFRQIVADLDIAIDGLPDSWLSNDYGRVTKGAAAAFKGRVLMFWASPQFNPNGDQNRWETAYQAAKTAKEVCEATGDSLYRSFDNIFLDEASQNKEAVLVRVYSRDLSTPFVHTWENDIRPIPIGINGGQETNPTYDLYAAFPMVNGLPITATSSGYSPVYFWKNRDPRFYATIAYNGSRWDYLHKSGDTVWTYIQNDVINGFPFKSNNWEGTPSKSGFYCRKASNPAITKTYVKETGTNWIEIRFAEVLMNYAECANEIGDINAAYTVLKAIRNRAGILPGTNGMYGLAENMTKEQMRTAILNERFIEFAFENKRYWDLRRHKLFTTYWNGKQRKGVMIRTKTPTYPVSVVDANRGKYDLENNYGTYFLPPIPQPKEAEGKTINYLNEYYFFDIPQSFLDRCPAVKQTKGWGIADSLSFDPLAE